MSKTLMLAQIDLAVGLIDVGDFRRADALIWCIENKCELLEVDKGIGRVRRDDDSEHLYDFADYTPTTDIDCATLARSRQFPKGLAVIAELRSGIWRVRERESSRTECKHKSLPAAISLLWLKIMRRRVGKEGVRTSC